VPSPLASFIQAIMSSDVASPAVRPDVSLTYVPDAETWDAWGAGRCGVYYLVIGGWQIGAVSLTARGRCHGEIGYEIDPAYRGVGHATRGVGLVVALVLPDHGFTMLTARVRSDNLASIRVLEKNGFSRAGAKLHWLDGAEQPASIATYCWYGRRPQDTVAS
jgi:RimJ/RimL family protein N-acetyltransferase